MEFDLLRHSSLFGLLGMAVSVTTMGMALAYAIRPSERRLALIRPLSLAAIFNGLGSFVVGLATILRGMAASAPVTPVSWQAMAAGFAESALGLFIAFSCLTIAWLLVTVGLLRS
ncbi:MAG TPA: hypothetical protein VFV95_15070 [Vicinamibacterales bacterium]|nr:hypothetical protein [Vicinamibacterales bacterium]